VNGSRLAGKPPSFFLGSLERDGTLPKAFRKMVSARRTARPNTRAKDGWAIVRRGECPRRE